MVFDGIRLPLLAVRTRVHVYGRLCVFVFFFILLCAVCELPARGARRGVRRGVCRHGACFLQIERWGRGEVSPL